MAVRTARTVMANAYTSLGRIEDAWVELEAARPFYREHNPYYLRFAIVEARILAKQITDETHGKRNDATRVRLLDRLQEIAQMAEGWSAPHILERIKKEYAAEFHLLKARAEDTQLQTDGPTVIDAENVAKRRLRLLTFGPLAVEGVDEEEPELTPKGTADTRSLRGRDTKVRQLISLLVRQRIEETNELRFGEENPEIAVVRRDRLVDTLWPESDEPSAINALYTSIKRARLFLGDPEAIVSVSGGYALGKVVATDLEEVLMHQNLARQARKRKSFFSIAYHYDQLLRLMGRGPLFDGMYGEWLDGLRLRIGTIHHSALVQSMHMDLERGKLETALANANLLLEADEFDEEAMKTTMIVAARKGQTRSVYTMFDNYAQRLRSELRTDPPISVKNLLEQIRSGTSV